MLKDNHTLSIQMLNKQNSIEFLLEKKEKVTKEWWCVKIFLLERNFNFYYFECGEINGKDRMQMLDERRRNKWIVLEWNNVSK